MLPDFPRLRLALGSRAEPDRSPKRFAPYTVWRLARITAIVGFSCFPLAIGLFALGWIVAGLLALAMGFLIVLPVPRHDINPLTPEIVGALLGSRYCPACGQSIFDRAPPTGYTPDAVRGTWWPHRRCASCGHGLKVRTID